MKGIRCTPGKWEVAKYVTTQGNISIEVQTETGLPVAVVRDCGRADGNAALIAAAPDLLAALQSITASYDKLLEAYGKPHGWGTIESDAAKAAIAKAGGAA